MKSIRINKKDHEIASLKDELEQIKDEIENVQKVKVYELQNILQQKDLENDQMKTIIYELNTQNKLFREELSQKSQTRSPEFLEIKDPSECNQECNSSLCGSSSKGMEMPQTEMTNRSDEIIGSMNLNSPEINPITPTEIMRIRNNDTFETPLNPNSTMNSFGEKPMDLRDISNIKRGSNRMNEETNEKKKMKKSPEKIDKNEKENIFFPSKNSTERNDSMLESINSSVYEKIVQN